MRTHPAWTLALASMFVVAVGHVNAQMPVPTSPGFATFSQGNPVVQAAHQSACGACDGAGCGICGVPNANGYQFSNHSACGCSGCDSGCASSGACGGGDDCCGSGCGLGNALSGFGGHNILGGHLAGHGGGGFAAMHHGRENGPFCGGGCCTPIWYDFHVEWMQLKRDDSGDGVGITSRNAGGPVVLSTDDADLDEAHGFRATYAFCSGQQLHSRQAISERMIGMEPLR